MLGDEVQMAELLKVLQNPEQAAKLFASMNVTPDQIMNQGMPQLGSIMPAVGAGPINGEMLNSSPRFSSAGFTPGPVSVPDNMNTFSPVEGGLPKPVQTTNPILKEPPVLDPQLTNPQPNAKGTVTLDSATLPSQGVSKFAAPGLNPVLMAEGAPGQGAPAQASASGSSGPLPVTIDSGGISTAPGGFMNTAANAPAIGSWNTTVNPAGGTPGGGDLGAMMAAAGKLAGASADTAPIFRANAPLPQQAGKISGGQVPASGEMLLAMLKNGGKSAAVPSLGMLMGR